MSMSDLTDKTVEQFRRSAEETRWALTEVLCSAFKDATGTYPPDRVREAIYEAVNA